MGGLIFYVSILRQRKGANNHEEIWLSQNKYKRATFRQRYGTKFAYINYVTKNTSVNILFSEAFYYNEYSNGVEEFERFIGKVQKLVNNSENPVEVITYGEITKKKRRKSGINVSVYSPKRILIDGMSYNEILYKDITKNIQNFESQLVDGSWK